MRVEVGDKVYIPEHKRPFTVRCRDNRYIVCTKPFNLKHSIFYFIIDLKEKRRGPDNLVFCMGYETDEQCLENLKWLQEGQMEVSHRYDIPLDIDIE